MAKDKKKKKDKKSGKGGATRATDSIKSLAQNPLVADVVAAALVATASALRDSNRARALASDAGEELTKLSKAGARQGEALWDMAVQIGRRSLEAVLSGDNAPKGAKSKAKGKAAARPASKSKSTAKGGKKSSSPGKR